MSSELRTTIFGDISKRVEPLLRNSSGVGEAREESRKSVRAATWTGRL